MRSGSTYAHSCYLVYTWYIYAGGTKVKGQGHVLNIDFMSIFRDFEFKSEFNGFFK